MSFSDKLKATRIKKGMSQKTLADIAGVSQAAIYQWEKGTRTPKIEQIQKIADALEVLPGELVDYKEIPISYQKDGSIFSMFMKIVAEDQEETDNVTDINIPAFLNSTQMISQVPKNTRKRGYKLLEHFQKLNETGQEKAIDHVEMLTKIPEYRKDEE